MKNDTARVIFIREKMLDALEVLRKEVPKDFKTKTWLLTNILNSGLLQIVFMMPL